MDLDAARSMALELMTSHGLRNTYKADNYWTFEFDRAKTRWGQCQHKQKIISLSKYYTEVNSEESIRDTILHEIAHALVGSGHGHNHIWRAKCLEIGAKPVRCEKGNSPEGKYIAICSGCEKVYHAYKRRRRLSSCGVCSKGSYNPEYRLIFQEATDEQRAR